MQESITNQRAVTIQDIAVSAGVSPTTVSMVLNGKAAQYRICTATRQRVEAVIAQSGYQPNRVARNMRLGRGTLVGLILAEGTLDVGELMAGLEPVLAAAGYSLVVVSGGTDPVTTGERIRRLNHDGLAGLIYGSGFPVGAAPLLAGLGPTMILGLPVGALPGVYHEDEAGGQPSPVGTRRSERQRGQAAGELLLALLAGSPPGNRIIPLDHSAGEAAPGPAILVIAPPAVVAPLPPVTIPVAPVIVTVPSSETQPAPIIIESPVVTGVSPVPAAEEAIDETSISEAPVPTAPAPAVEDPQPPAAIESAIPAEPILVEQPVAEDPPSVMVEPIPEPEPLQEPAPITIESEETPVPALEAQQPPPVVIEPAVVLEPETQQNPPSTEDPAEVESDSMIPKIEIPIGTYP
ncbi:MAG: LacI family DNA-binding transcriptional regulator [bacterium]